ncbi:MAG: YkgJ family cysteine cluster protein [Candidatus Hodarchaeales archaeon]
MRSPSEICLNCGQCCNGHNLELVLFPQDAVSLASRGFGEILCIQKTEDGDSEIHLNTRANGDCLFFDRHAKSCRIYTERPAVCRIFPYGESEASDGDSESREEWILKNCSLFSEYSGKSSLGINSLKAMANARRLEYELASNALRFVRDLIKDREKNQEEQWEFRGTNDYGLTFWAREKAPIDEIVKWIYSKSRKTRKSRVGVMLTFHDRHYRALCTIQGVFCGDSALRNQVQLPQCHEDLLEALDDFFDPTKDSGTVLLEGWEPWPPYKEKA